MNTFYNQARICNYLYALQICNMKDITNSKHFKLLYQGRCKFNVLHDQELSFFLKFTKL